jgi:hypothetical protein
MYIIRKQLPNTLAFKTFDGWDVFVNKSLELGNVMRFTKGEATRNTLPEGEEFVYFGCFKPLKKELK